MTILRDDMIGGGFVKRLFSIAGEPTVAGTPLTREQILGIRNRQALLDNGYLDIYPPAPQTGELHLVSRGFGKYDVIQGVKLNIEPLTKEQAEAMIPGPPAPPEGEEN